MRQESKWVVWEVLIALAVSCNPAWAQEAPTAPATTAAQGATQAPDKPVFLRVRYDDAKQPTALETAVVSYQTPDRAVRVDLVGAVHIADARYYDQLNDLFTSYDVVLYELVAPEGTRVPKGGAPTGSAVGGLQRLMKSALGLEFQLDRVDYTRANLVHADMSPEEFAQSMEDRGESFVQMFFRAMGQSAAVQSRPGAQADALSLWSAALRGDKAQMKAALAKQFEDLDGMMSALNGPEGSTILNERNRKAFEVLSRELEKGRRRIAVFYGAGHLPDMDQRLRTDFALKPTQTRWLTAWNLE